MAYVFRQTIHVKRRGLDLMDAVGIVDTQHALTTRARADRSEEHTSELQSPCNLVCRLLLEKKNGLDNLFAGVVRDVIRHWHRMLRDATLFLTVTVDESANIAPDAPAQARPPLDVVTDAVAL